jgi:CelD/BcsL family acetyltransferase involved in cellulose biosynthesis
VTVERLSDFPRDPQSTAEWDALIRPACAPTVFQTAAHLRAWCDSFDVGGLLLLRSNHTIGAFYNDGGFLRLAGWVGADAIDLVGNTGPDVCNVLHTARHLTTDFKGFNFDTIPSDSPTTNVLPEAARQLRLSCRVIEEKRAPILDLSQPTAFRRIEKYERTLRRQGHVEARHYTRDTDVLPRLRPFFHQHIKRWAATHSPSLFLHQPTRLFYHRLATEGAAAGWLRFAELLLDGKPIASHFGFCYRKWFLYYKPVFDLDYASFSPGQILLRHLIESAAAQGAQIFDFGLGAEPYKERFATGHRVVRTWQLSA